MRGPDPQTLLIRALLEDGMAASLQEATSEAWSSATFAGARHVLRFELAGDDAMIRADRFAEGLDEREFDLPGHLVADIAATQRRCTTGRVELTVEALTVEDC